MKDQKKITSVDMVDLLDKLYDQVLNGVPGVSKSIEDFSNDYIIKNSSYRDAVNDMLKNQILKCTTSGFITGFGGLITLPVAVPANIGSVLYVQMRMIASAAYISGYDVHCDQVQSLIYACLAGISVNEIIKKVGVKFGNKVAQNLINKIPGKVCIEINKKVGFRFITKAGEKGIINLSKLVPGVGAVINGGFDYFETKIIANRAYKWFAKNDFSVEENDEVIDVDFVEL